MSDDVLRRLSPRFDAIYAATCRPSIPPEHLLRTLLLQVLYSVRSERMLMEQLEYNLLFRWFVRLGMDDDVWAPTTFTNAYDINNDQTIVRAACKIGFNYAAKILGCETIRQRRFDAPGVLLGMTRLPYKLPQRGKGQCSSDRMLNPRESTRAVSAGTADSYVSW